MIINLFNKNIAKILLLFSLSPGSKYSRNEIKLKTRMNNVPLDNSLSELLTLKAINQKDRLYFINLENNLIMQIIEDSRKRLSNLPLNVQTEITEFISDISKIENIPKIILFGSYSKLIFSDKSDIDIAVILNSKENKKIEKKIESVALKISNKYKKDIQPHFFTNQDLKHKEDPLIKDILKNGRFLIE